MIKVQRRRKALSETADITSLIDVVFILLIFFMLTAVPQLHGISVQEPEASTAEVQKPVNVEVAITADEKIFFNKDPISLKDLRGRLSEVPAKSRISIKGDRTIPYELFVEVFDVTREFEDLAIVLTTKKISEELK